MHPSPVDITNKEIGQIGIIAKDVVKMAKFYSEILGIGPWVFFDFTGKDMRDMMYQQKPVPDGSVGLRIGLAYMGRMQIELIQPLLNDPTMYSAYLKKVGDGGVHHVSFNALEDHDTVAAALKELGTGIEMQGHLGDDARFTFWDTQKTLGTTFEALKMFAEETDVKVVSPWGMYEHKDPPLINPDGLAIKQIGIIVDDVEKTAQNYLDLFGVGPWTLLDFTPEQWSDCTLYGVNAPTNQCHLKVALAYFRDIQIELIEPIKGASTHRDFLTNYGQGIHHLSFGECKDYDKIMSSLTDNGIGIEMSGVLGGATRFAYFATRKELATVIEIIDTNPEVQMTIQPSGQIG